ncbi:MAG: hypothetical protein M1836_008031 [Candelina mexicana]|nr:MAG: hypothetical protein M1836_008031 [Candelina mexicana]
MSSKSTTSTGTNTSPARKVKYYKRHTYTPAQIRFILILRHVTPNHDCWPSIAASFNDAFGTSISVLAIRYQWQAVTERGAHGKTRRNEFYEYLQAHDTVPSSYQEEYEDVLRRYGANVSRRQTLRSPFSQPETRFIMLLEHASRNARCSEGDRWYAISMCFNDVHRNPASDNSVRAHWRKCRAKNGPLFRSLKENDSVLQDYQQEFLDILQLYEANKSKCFVNGIKTSSMRSAGDENQPPPKISRPTTDDERQFVILMRHFTQKSWDRLTECYNQEFGKQATTRMLVYHWSKDRSSNPLFKVLRDRTILPEELTRELERLLNIYGDRLTCQETHVIGHTGSGFVRPCIGPHTASHNVCEECKNAALEAVPGSGMAQATNDAWLCLKCRHFARTIFASTQQSIVE